MYYLCATVAKKRGARSGEWRTLGTRHLDTFTTVNAS